MSLLNNLSCYYKLDGNATRSFGTNDGSDTNVTYSAGKIGDGANYTGVSTSRTLIVDSTDWDLFGTANFAVSLWVKKTTNGTRQIFIGQSASSGAAITVSFLIEFTAANLVRITVGSGGGVSTFNSSNTITDTSWHHIVFQRDGSNLDLYIDNVARGTFPIGLNAIHDSTANVAFGRGGDLTTNTFPGAIDEVGAWKRKLELTEISRLYNNGNGLTYPFVSNGSQFFQFM